MRTVHRALERLLALERAVSGGVPGVRMELRVVTVPAELSGEPGARELFDRRFMERLEQLGYARAQSAAPWDSAVVSPYERPGGAAAR